MAYHQLASAAIPAAALQSHDSAREQRLNQVQYTEERLRDCISQAAVAGITAFWLS